MEQLTIGIDVSQEGLDIAYWDGKAPSLSAPLLTIPMGWFNSVLLLNGYLSDLLDRLSDLQTMRQMETNRLHAHQSKPVTSKTTLPSIKKSIQFFDRQIEQIQRAIDQHFDAHPPMKHLADNLLSIPGVGNKNVQFLVATLGRFDSLTDGGGTAKQLTAFVGLDPVPYQSGTSVLKRTAISNQEIQSYGGISFWERSGVNEETIPSRRSMNA